MQQQQDILFSISMDFLMAFAKIPRSQQKKVREFIQMLKSNPVMPTGCNYEKIKNCADSNMWSIRIDLHYRAIISHPSPNVYFLLWVDNHDAAYKWAEKNCLKIHPYTGGIQLINTQSIAPPTPSAPTQTAPVSLFQALSKEQLLTFGVPEEMLERVYGITTEEQLVQQEALFPQEAYNALFMFACGDSYETIMKEYQRANAKPVDTQDFSAALNNDDTLSRFMVVTDSVELEALLNAPLEKWRVFLHPLQRKIVEMNASGPVRVLGGAGTGKTVVAIHRAKYLVQHVFTDPHDRILFTTFTKNLAADILNALQQICPSEDLKKIEVVNLDAWTKNFLLHHNVKTKVIDYLEEKQNDFWKEALTHKYEECDLSDQFFHDEWTQVIQAQNIDSLEKYMKASRIGRGRRLNRLERKKLWPVWQEYRALLDENNFCEIQDLYRNATMLLKQHPQNLYKAVIVDESQDLSSQAFTMIRAMLPEAHNDIFIVGDAHQRIYGHKTTLTKCGIKITGRSKKLKVNYRTTDETYHYASSILTGLNYDDLDGQEDVLGKCQSLTNGPVPQCKCYQTFAEETAAILKLLEDLRTNDVPLEAICIASRTNNLVEQYKKMLEDNNIPCHVLSTETSQDSRHPGVRLGTMHRIKGIEFDYMILASVSEDIVPPKWVIEAQENETDRQAFIQQERSLLYVALTRARKAVFITGYPVLSPLLPHC